MEVDLISKKEDYKRNFIWPDAFSNNKKILTLLAKVITFYLGPIAVDVKGYGFNHISGWWSFFECLGLEN